MELRFLEKEFLICRLPSDSQVPDWVCRSKPYFIMHTAGSLSLVCEEQDIPLDFTVDDGWKCIEIMETMNLDTTGVLAKISKPLADAGISIFCLSTYETDFIFVREQNAARAHDVLVTAGYQFV